MSVSITRLTVEHYSSPLGIQHTSPRLSWRFEGDAKDWTQRSYTIKKTDQNGTEEKTIESEQSVLIPWPFNPLSSRQQANISIKAHGETASTEWASVDVEVGLLERQDWSAELVSGESQTAGEAKRPFQVASTFQHKGGRARLYVTSQGVYEMYINGKKVGDEILAPGWTQYNSQLVYRTHDVTDLLQEGENIIGAWVGEGWWAGRLGFEGGRRDIWGSDISLIAQLEIDGEVVCKTDDTWKWTYGSLIESSIYDGEIIDTAHDDKWSITSSWKDVRTLGFPSVQPSSTQSPPIREVERISPIELITTPSGKIVIDFGQNFAGYVEVLREPPKGETELIHFEVLEHNDVNLRPLRTAKCRDLIKHNGEWKGYKPKFTFHGFRYVQVVGWTDVKKEDLVGIVVSTAMERIGHFESSHKLLNRLHQNVVYSTVANCISLPTDCPQRDERLGWTGDVQVFAPTLNFLFDATGMLSGWMDDVVYEQSRMDGIVPIVVPSIDDHFKLPSAVWGDVVALLPAVLHSTTGDVEVVRKYYKAMVDWLERGVERNPQTGLWNPDCMQFGDWLAPQVEGSNGTTDPHLIADAYLIKVTRTVGQIAGWIGHEDEKRWNGEADRLLLEFQATYITAKHRIVSDTQAAAALILHFDLIHPDHPEQKEVLVKRLEKLVVKCLWQVATGFAGTPIILHVLAENNMLHHAYRMLQAKDSPSWLAPVLLGATTIWERWDSMRQDGSINPDDMVSFNHYALGEVASFLHKKVGGLSAASPGWKEVLVQPRPGGTVTSATVSHISPYGKVSCEWAIKGDTLEVDVVVPPNSSATIDLPGGEKTKVGSGHHHFSVPFQGDQRFPPTASRPHFLPPITNTYVP